MKAYKGFNKNMTCKNNFKYEERGEYECDSAKVCETGFHACEYPLDCFEYYDPANSVYHEVEQSGEFSKNNESDSKLASSKIKIGVRLSIKNLVDASIEYVKEKGDKTNSATRRRSANASVGGYSANSTTDWYSANASVGWYSANTSAEYRSTNSSTGEYSANASVGYNSANASVGDKSANSSVGCCSANSTTGSRSANASVGGYSANASVGFYSANTSAGDYSANLSVGYDSTNSSVGYGATNSATGEYSTNASVGYGSANISTGRNCKNAGSEASINVGWGRNNKCKGDVGAYLVLSEWGDWDGEKYPLISAKMVYVDGKEIKADVFYGMKKGEIVECNK